MFKECAYGQNIIYLYVYDEYIYIYVLLLILSATMAEINILNFVIIQRIWNASKISTKTEYRGRQRETPRDHGRQRETTEEVPAPRVGPSTWKSSPLPTSPGSLNLPLLGG